MSLRSSKIVPALLLLLFGCICLPDERRVVAQKGDDPKRVVVFSVTSSVPSETFMEPVLILDGESFVYPIGGDADDAELAEFTKAHYGSGQKYRLISGGSDAGSVAVEKSSRDTECFRAGAYVKLSTRSDGVKLNRNVMALATNFRGSLLERSSRRAPTTSERAEAIRLAKQVFLAKGSPAGLLSTLEVVNLTALDLDRDGQAELIGSFVLKKTKGGAARHVLFMLAERQGKAYRAAISNYNRYTTKDIMSGGSLDSIGAEGIYTERLVDQLDLDTDGTSEVFTITNAFESASYNIYKREAGVWKSVYEFSSYRCGF